MKTFFLCMFGSAVVVYAAVMLLYMIAGDAAWLIAGLLALGAVFGLLACALEKRDRASAAGGDGGGRTDRSHRGAVQ